MLRYKNNACVLVARVIYADSYFPFLQCSCLRFSARVNHFILEIHEIKPQDYILVG